MRPGPPTPERVQTLVREADKRASRSATTSPGEAFPS